MGSCNVWCCGLNCRKQGLRRWDGVQGGHPGGPCSNMTGVPGRGRLETDPQGEEGVLGGHVVNQHGKKEAKTEVVWPGAPEAGRGWEGSSPRAPGGSAALPTPSLQTSRVQNCAKWIVSHPASDTWLRQPRETNTCRVYSRDTDRV